MSRKQRKILILALLGILLLAMANVPRCEARWCNDCGRRHETAYVFGTRVGTVDYQCRLSPWVGKHWSLSTKCPHPNLANSVERGGLELLLKYNPLFCPICSNID
jgi:hypothetical protein